MIMRLWRKRLTWALAAVCGCLVIAFPGVLAATASPSHGAVAARNGNAPLSSARPGAGVRPGTQFTPVTASTLTVPEPVKGSDGRIHLAYELLLTNVTAVPVRNGLRWRQRLPDLSFPQTGMITAAAAAFPRLRPPVTSVLGRRDPSACKALLTSSYEANVTIYNCRSSPARCMSSN